MIDFPLYKYLLKTQDKLPKNHFKPILFAFYGGLSFDHLERDKIRHTCCHHEDHSPPCLKKIKNRLFSLKFKKLIFC